MHRPIASTTLHPAFFTADYRREHTRDGNVTLGLMTLLSREREAGEVWREARGVRYHAAAVTIDSEMQKWKKQRAARESRKARPDEGKVLSPLTPSWHPLGTPHNPFSTPY